MSPIHTNDGPFRRRSIHGNTSVANTLRYTGPDPMGTPETVTLPAGGALTGLSP